MALPALLVPIGAGLLALGKEYVGGYFAKEVAKIALEKAVVYVAGVGIVTAGASYITKEICGVAKNSNDFEFGASKGNANFYLKARN